MSDLLTIENLRAGYGQAVVLPNMSLRLPESQVLALLGRNGTGKTTLINSIVGVTRRFAGNVTLGGVDADGLSSSTMMSRTVPGLYFIGEVVDVTGWLGGYNFQWAWASGQAAGGVC